MQFLFWSPNFRFYTGISTVLKLHVISLYTDTTVAVGITPPFDTLPYFNVSELYSNLGSRLLLLEGEHCTIQTFKLFEDKCMRL